MRKVIGNLSQEGRLGKGHCRDVRAKVVDEGTRPGL